jgi:hypothetical protein
LIADEVEWKKKGTRRESRRVRLIADGSTTGAGLMDELIAIPKGKSLGGKFINRKRERERG